MAGLVCARRLLEQGRSVVILEADDHIGGRVRTDLVDGYRLDRGFQVYFTAYPNARTWIDEKALSWAAFEPGAKIWHKGKWHLVHQRAPLAMAVSTFLSISDKIKLLSWSADLSQKSYEELWHEPDTTAQESLIQYGFSDHFLERFARPFFGGIFLDRSLGVSSQMFRFVWKALQSGRTVVPIGGMQMLAEAIARPLPERAVRLRTPVAKVHSEGVTLQDGESIEAEAIVVATGQRAAKSLLPQLPEPEAMKGSCCLYFACDVPPIDRPILHLDASGLGMVNHVVPVSIVDPSAAPDGGHLISATVLNAFPKSGNLAEDVRYELSQWFPKAKVHGWRHLWTYSIEEAQLAQSPGFRGNAPSVRQGDRIFLTGEWTTYSSIDGAILSGEQTAAEVLREPTCG